MVHGSLRCQVLRVSGQMEKQSRNAGENYSQSWKSGLFLSASNPHKSGDIPDSLLHETLRQADISKDEWLRA